MRRFASGLAVLLCVAVGVLFIAGNQLLSQPLAVGEGEQRYLVRSGAGLHSVAREFSDRGWLQYPRYVVWAAQVRGLGADILAGEYRVRSDMTFSDLLLAMRDGRVITHSVTFPEGWNISQLRAQLESTSLQIRTKGLDNAALMEALGHPGVHPEGRFFPDTYLYSAGMSDLDLLAQAHARMESVLAEEWEGREEGLPYETAYEALIMASIVEKETGLASERAAIAGVFVRRLRKGMRLQTDPTVIYGLGPAWSGNLTRKHLRQATPYNTYVIYGLPPTPIAMPGREAINAALHPEKGSALYFVARGDGSHQFSATLAEHVNAVKKYQIRQRAKEYRSAPKQGAQ